ncbi:D-methionine transport system ATP-binding protein [Gracilibacillus halotolerans]|uniref:D-methionine transport system ATP-binding protein n=1 Tax=Gracilibacillus halotolerans TaxID=74386 RepID=A0A841RGN8_9BACI|nr:methionine ABC transporter ATP-binding protein [Gracilibacillus halotolerans]MBB6513300.1 D-methionine transport system ATP-binding protein [Gracilibacillus halotolerans]
MIEFHQVTKIFESNGNKVEALKNINLTIDKGDIFGVIGFSGAGKSTLIRTVNLLEYPSAGEVLVKGKNLTELSKYEIREAKKDIGMIFQHFNLIKSKTVFHNVAMPLLLSGYNKKSVEEKVFEILRFVGLEEKAKNYPDQLSGGQKQRVGIARALITNPSILLCDEATSALDPETTKSILKLLKRINKEYNITILIITHEMEVIKEICNRIAVMEDGQIIETGKVFDVFANPKKETTRNFVKSVIRDEVPKSVYQLLREKNHYSRIFKIEFFGANSGQPIISKTAKVYDVEINVLFGNITELQGIPFGNLIVELIGNDHEINRAVEYIISQDIRVKEVTEDGSKYRNNIKCVVGNTLHG